MHWQEALEQKARTQHTHLIFNDDGALIQGPTRYADTYRFISDKHRFQARAIPSARQMQHVLNEFDIPSTGWR